MTVQTLNCEYGLALCPTCCLASASSYDCVPFVILDSLSPQQMACNRMRRLLQWNRLKEPTQLTLLHFFFYCQPISCFFLVIFSACALRLFSIPHIRTVVQSACFGTNCFYPRSKMDGLLSRIVIHKVGCLLPPNPVCGQSPCFLLTPVSEFGELMQPRLTSHPLVGYSLRTDLFQ